MSQRLDADAMDRLFDAVCGPTETTPGEDERDAVRAVYAILRAGAPVGPTRLAAATGWQAARAQALLERLPNVERDEHDQVIAFGGLTLRPTPHKLTIDGQTRYAWCAWDTLFLPVALDTTIDVTSACPQTGQSITLTVAPTGIRDHHPPGVVLSCTPTPLTLPTCARASAAPCTSSPTRPLPNVGRPEPATGSSSTSTTPSNSASA